MNQLFDRLLANAIEKQFLHRCTAEAQTVLPNFKDAIIERVGVTAQELFERNEQACPDFQTRII